MGSRDDDARESAEIGISSDELRAVGLRDRVNHGVGPKCVRNESPECDVIVSQQQLLVNLVDDYRQYEKFMGWQVRAYFFRADSSMSQAASGRSRKSLNSPAPRSHRAPSITTHSPFT